MGKINIVSMSGVESLVPRVHGGRRNDWEEFDPKRPYVVEAIRRHLADVDLGGMILQGPIGSGKRETVHEVMAAESYFGRDIHLCGTLYAQFLRYGALHFLLSEMSNDELASPLSVYEHLKLKLRESGAKPVFVIERVDLIDPWTIIVLTQLTYAKEIKLLVIDDLGESMPTEITCLAHSGFLAVHRIEPLTVSETREMVKSISDLYSTEYVSTCLWSYSEGNPQWLHSLVVQGLSQEILKQRDGWLVSASRQMPTGGAVGEVARSRVAGLSREQRQVLNQIAAADHSAANELVGSQGEIVDSLFEAGFLSLGADPSDSVHMKSPILRDCLLAMSRRDDPEEPGTGGDGVQTEVIDEESLTTEFGTSVNGERSGVDPIGRIRCEANRLMCAGKSTEALAMISRCRTVLLAGGMYGSRLLTSSNEFSVAHDDLMLLELRVSIRVGDAASITHLLGALDPECGEGRWAFMDRNRQLEATAYMAEAFLRLHRWTEALPKVKWLGRHVLASEGFLTCGSNTAVSARTVRSLLASSVALGEWTLSRDLCGLIRSEPVHDPDLADFAEAIRAMLLIAKGDVKSAASILRPMEKQLLAGGPPEEHEAVAAVLAFCHAETGNLDASAQYLYNRPFQEADETPYGWFIEFFRAMSIAKIHSPDAGNLRLLALSRSPVTVEDPLLRMYALAVSVRQGNLSDARDLEEMTLGFESGLAEAFGRFALGVSDNDTQLITNAFVSFIELGFAAFASEPGNVPFTLLTTADQRTIQRKLKTTVRSGSEIQSWNGKKLEVFPADGSLTRRERFIAAAAAGGLSNSEIAGVASVSVRTVEGHLYQIYSKLGLRGRAGLTDLLSSSKPYGEALNAGK